MGINFNPSVSIKPVSQADFKKSNNIDKPEEKAEKKTSEKLTPDAQISGTTLAALRPDAISMAELIARANIIMAQEYGTPSEVAASMDYADIYYNKALRLEKSIISKAQKITEFYNENKTDEAQKSPLREVFEGKDGIETMVEYAPNGDIIRKSSFKNGALQRAEEFRPDNKKNILVMQKEKPAEYLEGLEETDEGRTMEKYFTFENGEKLMYFEDYSEFDDGSSGASKWIWFENGKMSAYYEDMENTAEGDSKIGLHLRYDEDGTLFLYIEDIENGIPKGKHFVLEDGKWIEKTE